MLIIVLQVLVQIVQLQENSQGSTLTVDSSGGGDFQSIKRRTSIDALNDLDNSLVSKSWCISVCSNDYCLLVGQDSGIIDPSPLQSADSSHPLEQVMLK